MGGRGGGGGEVGSDCCSSSSRGLVSIGDDGKAVWRGEGAFPRTACGQGGVDMD